jgi:hypothetical protein
VIAVLGPLFLNRLGADESTKHPYLIILSGERGSYICGQGPCCFQHWPDGEVLHWCLQVRLLSACRRRYWHGTCCDVSPAWKLHMLLVLVNAVHRYCQHVKMPWHQFGLPCLIRTHFLGLDLGPGCSWTWTTSEKHPCSDLRWPQSSCRKLGVTYSCLCSTTFDLDGVEVTCACAHVWHLSLSWVQSAVGTVLQGDFGFGGKRCATPNKGETVCRFAHSSVALWIMVPGMFLLRNCTWAALTCFNRQILKTWAHDAIEVTHCVCPIGPIDPC